jgi:hypothetical protein
MDIRALKQEESKLKRQLTASQGAIAALNGGAKTMALPGQASSPNGASGKKAMSPHPKARTFLHDASLRRRQSEDFMLSSWGERRKEARSLDLRHNSGRTQARADRQAMPCPALEFCISDAIFKAEKIMRKIDSLYPTSVS